jgi:hypothetical protein
MTASDRCNLAQLERLQVSMATSIWSTQDNDVMAVCEGVDPNQAVGKIKRADHGWTIVEGSEEGSSFKTMYEAADALARTGNHEDYKDYLLGKGEDSRTVRTTAEQMRVITEQGGWKMISASAPRYDEVN